MKKIIRKGKIVAKICECGAILVDDAIIHYYDTDTHSCELCGRCHKGMKLDF